MRSLIVSVMLIMSAPASADTNTVDIGLVSDPAQLPAYVCVLSVDPPASCAPNCPRLAKAGYHELDEFSSAGNDAGLQGAIAALRLDAPFSLRTFEVDAVLATLRDLVHGDSSKHLASVTSNRQRLSCRDTAVCPTSFIVPDGAFFVQCTKSKSSGRSEDDLVAVLSVMGHPGPIQEIDLQQSQLTITFRDAVKTLSIAVVGGNYAPGLAAPVTMLRTSSTRFAARALVPLDRRCEPRTLDLPRSAKPLDSAGTLVIADDGPDPIMSCTPEKPNGTHITSQIPLAQEGIARTLVINGERSAWAATTSWRSHQPPVEMHLAWTHLSFDIRHDCLMPPDWIGGGCPDVAVPGATTSCALDSTDRGVCHCSLSALPGSEVTTPTEVTMSYDGMTWTAHLERAFSEIEGRPPPEVRRAYFPTFDSDAAELWLQGSRGLAQLVKRPASGAYSWVAMPGLECGESVEYRYGGRFDHVTRTTSLENGFVNLARPVETLAYRVSLFLGSGLVFDEMYQNEGYGEVGGELTKPFSRKALLGARFAFGVGLDFQFTERPYVSIAEERGSTMQHHAFYQRQLASFAFGAVGIIPCSWCGWWDVWHRLSIGRGTPISSGDNSRVGANDGLVTDEVDFDLRIGAHLAFEAYAGAVFGEDLLRWSSTLHGQTIPETDAGWHELRGLIGLRLKVRP